MFWVFPKFSFYRATLQKLCNRHFISTSAILYSILVYGAGASYQSVFREHIYWILNVGIVKRYGLVVSKHITTLYSCRQLDIWHPSSNAPFPGNDDFFPLKIYIRVTVKSFYSFASCMYILFRRSNICKNMSISPAWHTAYCVQC